MKHLLLVHIQIDLASETEYNSKIFFNYTIILPSAYPFWRIDFQNAMFSRWHFRTHGRVSKWMLTPMNWWVKIQGI